MAPTELFLLEGCPGLSMVSLVTVEGHSKGNRNKGKTLSKNRYGPLASSSTSALPNGDGSKK